MWPMFLSHPSCKCRVIRINNMALIINPAKTTTEWRRRERERERERTEEGGGGRTYPERGQTSSQRPPICTHPRYCDTAFMSAPVQHKPNGLVSGSKCPWEQSPLAETKRGWLRCHLHHKGKPFLPEPLPLRRAAHHIYQRLCTHVTSAFFFFLCVSVAPLLFSFGRHRLSTRNHINNSIPSPSVLS